MTTYVALVRGINVGTSTLVPMPDFQRVLEQAGFTNVKTLLRSGNAVFDSATSLSADDIVDLEKRFAEVTGVSARFVVLEGSEFVGVVRENPLVDVSDDPSRLLISFLPDAAPPASTLVFPDADGLLPEIISLGSRAVYAWCPHGVSKSAIPLAFWKQFGLAATTRNANTANKLVSLVLPRLEG
ncbi:Uncharacterized conserved protein, DUF1697 family [Agreia bicolorata]|uniref:Uncharacterized conserved protein, DUF1697 family n=1 Tax=Agreia bicolorata TaxID=110935 RepID=A0A1T4YIT8_9MICO|nr:DUF1697 domain-containing protein [Agreia bicolorata]SKB01175.1 Uncharacterized conserved protein, DUF1697 family [Agreia bicolorata]